MSVGLHAERAHSSSSGFTPIHGAMLQRKCACGGSSGLTGSCSECEKKKLVGQPLQTKLRINEPGDQYEQEADRAAEQVMRMADSDFNSSHRQSSATAQRRVAGDELANMNGSMIQRAEAASETPVAESSAQTDTGPAPEEGSRCSSWRGDPQSISKRAAETYVQNDITPPSQATVEKIDCEPPIANGNYGCYVHFSDGLVVRVIVREKDIVVGMGPGPITTLTPPPATPLCFYDYACPDGDLVLTVIECKSAKPAAPPGPTLVGQRRAAAGATGSMDATPMVHSVLATSGQPLDAATREFFSSRFGHDFANVRVHADAAAAESARSLHALAYTVGGDVVFGAGQYAPGTRAGQQLLAHELAHVVQQTASSASAGPSTPRHGDPTPAVTTAKVGQAHAAHADTIQRQPTSDGPTVRDLPIFLEKLELDIGQNLQDYGHHLYQAATLHRDEPAVLRNAFSRFALGRNVLTDSFRFAGFKPDTADKLALGTGILFKGLTLLRAGELTLDFQVDIGRGVKFETNIDLGVNPKDVTDVRKGRVNFGFVRRF